jgi:hypothetical protein
MQSFRFNAENNGRHKDVSFCVRNLKIIAFCSARMLNINENYLVYFKNYCILLRTEHKYYRPTHGRSFFRFNAETKVLRSVVSLCVRILQIIATCSAPMLKINVPRCPRKLKINDPCCVLVLKIIALCCEWNTYRQTQGRSFFRFKFRTGTKLFVSVN